MRPDWVVCDSRKHTFRCPWSGWTNTKEEVKLDELLPLLLPLLLPHLLSFCLLLLNKHGVYCSSRAAQPAPALSVWPAGRLGTLKATAQCVSSYPGQCIQGL